MAMSSDRQDARGWPLALLGAVCALAGAVLLVGLFVVVYAENEPLSRYALGLGLAGTTLISAVGQVAVLVGLWLVWRARRRAR